MTNITPAPTPSPFVKHLTPIRKILIEDAKLRDWKVFKNELKQFLYGDNSTYYFLSDDYYEHYLIKTEAGLKLEVLSEDPEILGRVGVAEVHLAQLLLV